MGLDMSLMQRIRKEENIEDTDVELVYWRKANAIHSFFVGEKDYESCDVIEVSKEMLVELLNKCEEVIKNKDKAEDILPSCSGFFFGSTLYEDYYFQDLQETIDKITPIISDEDIKDGELYYYGWY
jgi:hypothetical protein|tara:strand:+ start:118 stop:495 length:378 start_codon:yes stop_codon:yes gene_type:complete